MSDLLRRLNYLPVWRSNLLVWGTRIYHPSGDRWLYLKLHQLGLMGRSERKIIKHFLRPGMSVIDVGSNIGLYTMLFSQLVGETGQVVAIEPITDLRDSMQQSIKVNGRQNITVLPFAAGSISSTVKFKRDAFNSGNNWISATDNQGCVLDIPVKRLDSLKWERQVDFIKIDVQGWESEVMRGLSTLILSHSRPIIMCEISQASLHAAESSASELGQLFEDYCYEIYLPEIKKDTVMLKLLNLPKLEEQANLSHYFDIIALPALSKKAC